MNDRDAFCRSLDIRRVLEGLRAVGMGSHHTLGTVHYDLRVVSGTWWSSPARHAIVAVYALGTSWEIGIGDNLLASGSGSQVLLAPIILYPSKALRVEGAESVVAVELLVQGVDRVRSVNAWPTNAEVKAALVVDRTDDDDGDPSDGTT